MAFWVHTTEPVPLRLETPRAAGEWRVEWYTGDRCVAGYDTDEAGAEAAGATPLLDEPRELAMMVDLGADGLSGLVFAMVEWPECGGRVEPVAQAPVQRYLLGTLYVPSFLLPEGETDMEVASAVLSGVAFGDRRPSAEEAALADLGCF